MTREEAREYFEHHMRFYCVTGVCREAEEMAIAALEAEPCEDAISRRAVLDLAVKIELPDSQTFFCISTEDVEALPSVTPMQSGWIPVTFRPMTDEEKKDYSARTGYDEEDLDTMINCQLPEDGETVLITDRLGNVEVDTFINDCDGCYFECNCDMDDVKAWMPLPAPYKAESEEQA